MNYLSQDKSIKISYLSSGKWDVGQVGHGISTALGKELRCPNTKSKYSIKAY